METNLRGCGVWARDASTRQPALCGKAGLLFRAGNKCPPTGESPLPCCPCSAPWKCPIVILFMRYKSDLQMSSVTPHTDREKESDGRTDRQPDRQAERVTCMSEIPFELSKEKNNSIQQTTDRQSTCCSPPERNLDARVRTETCQQTTTSPCHVSTWGPLLLQPCCYKCSLSSVVTTNEPP